MKNTISNHRIPLRAHLSNPKTARYLNLPLLAKIVQSAIDDLPHLTLKSKRKASHELEGARRAKRSRTSRASQDHDEDDQSSDSGDLELLQVVYPKVQATQNKLQPDAEFTPILRHVLEVRYDKGATVGDMPEESFLHIWDREEEDMQETLFSLSKSLSAPHTVELGEVFFGDHEGSAVCVPSNPFYNFAWLLRVPPLDIDVDANDISSHSSADLLLATRMLQDAGRAQLTANLKIVVYPQDDESYAFPFSLQLEFIVSIVFPNILERIPYKQSNKRTVQALEDAQRRLLRAAFLPEEVAPQTTNNPITVSSLYSVMGPASQLSSEAADAAMQPEAMLPTLLPFQRRSVGWLLEREGMSITADGRIVPDTAPREFSFWEHVNADLYFNRLSGELVDSKPYIPTILGGMLAEEPGLGKTVETIALILLNPAPPEWNPSLFRWDPNACLDIKATKSTLIVTPPALAPQWKSELAKHAPSLKVLIYDGWTEVKVPITKNKCGLERFARMELNSRPKKRKNAKGKGKNKANGDDDDMEEGSLSRSDNGEILDWCTYVHQFDVVITTYSVLRSEIHVARPPPDRPRREEAPYYSPPGYIRSPLVMVEWKRVVMDEVQMVGGGQAAEMVSLIPRLSSLAVSGTPAKSQMSDLIHVLKFLRLDQLVGDLRLWNRLLKPAFAEEFSSFLRHYGVRTMKASVTAELTIPQQTRYLVGVDLGKVERHVYDQALEDVLLQLGLDARGVAASTGWQANSNVLRTSIRQLRGICTHPQVGQLQKKGDGVFKAGALKTIQAVLESMREQNWKNLMEDWKAKIQLIIRHAQLQQKDDSVMNHHQSALKTLELAETETSKHIGELKDVLADHDAKGKILKEAAVLLRQKRDDAEIEPALGDNNKGKAREKLDDREDEGGKEDLEENDLPKTPAGDEHRTKRRAIKQRLREGLLMLHRVKFLQGDVCHVLGKSEAEDASYQAAEKLRRELLKVSEEDAKNAMILLHGSGLKNHFTLQDLTVDLPFLGKGGIRSVDLMEEVNTLIENVFNEQTGLVWKWRMHILGLLTKPLNPGEDEADGQEYQRTLDDQGEAETYLQAYVAVLADRREALINERTLLAAHDVREKQLRHTKAAMKAAAGAMEDVPEGLELQPEHEVLHAELSFQRKNILLKLQGRSIKSILVELNAIAIKILQADHPEKILVKKAVEQLRDFISEQTSLHDKLDADLTLLRKAFNQRILYFRHLQEISDSVAEVEWEEASVMAAIQVCVTDKAQLDAKINTTRARQRYLDNLSQNQDSGVVEEDEKSCILCRCDFVRGFITQCAHVFCELCMKAWLVRKEGKSCPVCRVPIDPATIHRFSISAPEVEPPPQPIAGESAPQSLRKINYNRIDPNTFAEIQVMETYGDFGSKIQTLVRHLSLLKLTDTGAKSIIFSAWADSLHIVERALRDNGIQCLRIDQGSKSATEKFASDPELLVLLLHGERENAGLNVTCASRVFLLESVVHHSFEIQAIARIDRLGQTRPTEVYCYYAEDTIERNILDLAARKGLSLYTKENSSGTVSISPFTRDNEQGIDDPEKRKNLQKGDFIHKVDDMLSILFPHMFEDVEYLLPPDAIAGIRGADGDVVMASVEVPRHVPRAIGTNAVAGPSRLC